MAQEKPATEALDRSAEPALKKMLASYAKLQSFHCVMWKGTSAKPGQPFLYNGSNEVWYGGGTKFRFDSVGYFGNGIRGVSDGVKYMYDPLTAGPGTKIAIGKATTDIMSMDSAFRFGGSGGTPLFALLIGEKIFEKIIPKDAFIREVKGENGLVGISAGSDGAGVITFFYLPNDPLMLVRRIENDGVSTWKAAMQKSGKGYAEMGGRVNRQDIYYTSVNTKLDASIFSTVPPKGFEVIDIDKRDGERRIRNVGEPEGEETGEKGK